MGERHEMADPPAHRDTHQMGSLQAQGVEQADGVLCQVAQRIVRGPRLVADRSAGVAVVVADDEPGAGHQSLAEPPLPPVHRGCPSHDEQDGGVGYVAERLGAEVDPVGPDDPLVGFHRPNLGTRCGRLLWGPGVVAVARHDGVLLNGCGVVYPEHTAMVLRSTIDLAPRGGTEALKWAPGSLSDLGYARSRILTSEKPLRTKF